MRVIYVYDPYGFGGGCYPKRVLRPGDLALSLTTQLADDPTASALQPLAGGGSRNDPTSVPSAAALPPSMEGAVADGRRRRRLGRKRKRRPLQEDYWSLGDGKAMDEFEPIAGPSDPSPPSGGRMSDRKRLPYAGAAASRWEGIGPQRKPSEGKLGGRPSDSQPPGHHHRLLGRPNDWMDNPYTDAGGGTAAMYQRRVVPPTATSGNFAPIDSNRARKVPAMRQPEQQPSAPSPGATGGGHKAYRKPYSRRNEETSGESSNEATGPRLSPAPTTDLKALLKQSDGSLSLSEILQQRNISLQDLIKGKQMALAALTQSPLDVTTTTGRLSDDDTTTVSPTLASVRFRVSEEFVTNRSPVAAAVTVAEQDENHLPSGSGTSETPPPTKGKHPQLVAQPEDDTNNSVDDVVPSRAASDDDTGVAIFPTVEIKQLALNPVLPVVKETPEQRMRPIKGVASRIRPDLSNTHIRTDPVAPLGRFPETVTTPSSPTAATNGSPTISSFLLATSTARERWTPSASLVERHREQLQHKQQSLVTGSTEQAPMADELVSRPRSAESSSSLPEAEAMVGPERHHLLRVPKLKARIAIKPRLPNAVAATAAGVEQSSTASPVPKVTEEEPDRFNLSDVELTDDSGAQELTPGGGSDGVRPSSSSSSKNSSTSTSQSRRQQRLNDDEPELNIIEKFTSFADPPSAPSSVSSPVGQDEDEDAEQAVAELIGRISEHTQRSFTDSLEDFYRDVTESNPSLFNDLSPVASSDDRRELLELMEDRRIGSRLAKVLSQRNMTLEQLLEHRRRGSSQLHLAEIANGKVKPIDDKIDIVTAFEHFPRFNIGNLRSIRPDDIKLDSQGFSYFTSIINIRPSADDGYKEARALHAGRQWGSRRHPAAVAEGPSVYPANHRSSSDGHFLARGGSKDRLLVPSRISAATGPYERPGEQSEEQMGAADSDLLDLELSGHGFQHQHHRAGGGSVMIESTSMPAGVRSAIVASSAIVGVSLAIFISIYVVCRLRQRRRSKLNYTENFNMAKGRLPIIHSSTTTTDGRKSSASGRSNVSSLGTEQQVVYTTHRALMTGGQPDSGRPTDTMDSNNSLDVQDYLWDRKPFQ
ncbi:uncharacterized protein LOC128270016 [Anopheles cruzii]|uniref:uncharacterized protein LOC128270016 n=1 Tax=Anopheles cruzii TaxID=68878 RepID=UPI0022EC3FE0|nr:uncharacterized protein LOC128270016 [Anopheles cruzii]